MPIAQTLVHSPPSYSLLLLTTLLAYACGCFPVAQHEVTTVTFSVTGIGGDFSPDAVILTVDGVVYRVADLPASFSWTTGSMHSYQWAEYVPSVTYDKRYAWRSTSGLVSGMGGVLFVPVGGGTVLAEYIAQYLWIVSAEGIGPDVAFPRAPVSVDGVFIDLGSLPSSFWWDEGSQHLCCFEEFLQATGYKRYAYHGAGCYNLTVVGPGVLSGSYHVEYRVYVWVGRGSGSTDPPPGEYWVDNSSRMLLTAIPERGYAFEEWTHVSAECSTYERYSNPTELFVCGQISLRANFREVKPFDFSMRVEPSTILVYKSGSTVVGLVVLSEGEPPQAVSLNVLNVPKGVTCSLGTESAVPPISTTLVITVLQEAEAGVYTLTIRATSGNITKEFPLTLTILEYERPWYKQPLALVAIGVAIATLVALSVLIRLYRKR